MLVGTALLFPHLLMADQPGEQQQQSFSLRLLSQVVEAEPDANVLLSPASVTTVLKMLAEGGTPQARQAISNLLSKESSATTATVVEDTDVILTQSSAVFVDNDVVFDPAYQQLISDRYQAKVEALDFADPETLAHINTWVDQATGGKIKKLIDRLDKQAMLVVSNAIYFKGSWRQPFDPRQTQSGDFQQADCNIVQVPMMHLDVDKAPYREDEHFQAIELAYGAGRYRMVLVLPKDKLDATAMKKLENAQHSWLQGQGFTPGKGKLSMPRFEMRQQVELLDVLKLLGLEKTLNDPASFSGIASPAPQISRIVQKAVLTVNEKGSEAVAATAAIGSRSFQKVQNFEMKLNRPFLLSIRDASTKEMLFLGKVAKPNASVIPAQTGVPASFVGGYGRSSLRLALAM